MGRIILSLLLLSCKTASTENTIRKFPEGFKFGASTAAFQNEGAWNEDGKGPSIWDIATHSPSAVIDGSTADVASDSYHLYKRDVEMMKELGLDFYRFSVSWPRILPNGFIDNINQAGINYYNKLIDEMLKNNIVPFLTMYHWDLPEGLQKLGGWTNPAIVDWFEDYAKVVFDSFGDRVKHWITINEPKQICYEGYGTRSKAPLLNMGPIATYLCAKNILLAHAKVYHLYDEHYRSTQRGSVGISLSFTWIEPSSDSQEDQEAAFYIRQAYWGMYISPIFSKDGDFPQELKNNIANKSSAQGFGRSLLPSFSRDEVEYIRGSSDFFGLNTYTTKIAHRKTIQMAKYNMTLNNNYASNIQLIKNSSWPQAYSSWLQEVPWGFRKVLIEIKKLYNNPIVYVTENGWSTSGGLVDNDRIHYLRSYLDASFPSSSTASSKDAVEEGCNIKGYTVFSLMDNFEWFRGYTVKFGLYEVDFSDPNRTRVPRKSAFVYKEIIKTKALDFNYDLNIKSNNI